MTKGYSLSVLHITRADNSGGSARSAYKIHSGLRRLGLQSRMLVQIKVTDDPDVQDIHGGSWRLRALDSIGRRVIDRLSLQYCFYPSSFALVQHPWFRAADVIQLYNIHGGFFSFRALPKLTGEKVGVWRLSDMWAFTGHCSYSHDCDRWRVGCGCCPLLGEYPSLGQDTTAFLWRVKKRVYGRSRLVIVATNSWMEKLVKESPLLGSFPVYRIPNGVDTDVFRPIAERSAREVLNIEPSLKVVLFIAHGATVGTRKGGDYVPGVMERVIASGVGRVALVVVGQGAESWADHPAYQTIRVGFMGNDRYLATVYSAADVLIHPAVAENFPNSILESMACATPAVTFNAGGVGDAVRHMETGYLAGYKDSEDLARGIRLLLEDNALREKLGTGARKVVEEEYTVQLQARRYAKLYERLIAEGRYRMLAGRQ